ncbi:MAG: amino acid ABC transporter permease [Chloroflexota bacterium]|nr:amino acid ABC transporter permease [Chloroflexota bacterium]
MSVNAQTVPTIDRKGSISSLLRRPPYWLIFIIILGLIFIWKIISDEDYTVIFQAVVKGVGITIKVSVIAYALSMALGLLIALMRVSHRRVLQEISTFYVEVIRGLPMLVLLYFIVFAGAPAMAQAVNAVGEFLLGLGILTGLGQALAGVQVRDFDFTTRVIIALTIGYSAFLSEVFRAGIESIERGQMEAARSLGMSNWQAMRYVILPQAVRRVLPPLGNNFIAMLKDSSLVSVMGVADITFQGKVYAASTFKFFETYNVVGFLYLIMTIGLALAVRAVERHMSTSE